MKQKNSLIFGLLVALVCGLSAQAQRAYDLFSVPNSYVLPGTNVTTGVAPPGYTNQPVDMHGGQGIAVLDVFAFTNAGGTGQVLTVTPQTSPDQTNWTTLANYAIITNTTAQAVSNFIYGGTGLTATNFQLNSGTQTTPTAATAGFAGTYFAPLPFTNNAAFVAGIGWNSIGFAVQDANRYLRLIYTATGTSTNWTFGAQLSSYRAQMNFNGP